MEAHGGTDTLRGAEVLLGWGGSTAAYRSARWARLATIDRASAGHLPAVTAPHRVAYLRRLPGAPAGGGRRTGRLRDGPVMVPAVPGPHWSSSRPAILGHGRSSPASAPDRSPAWSASPRRSWSGRSGRRRRTSPAGRRTAPSIGARPPPPPPTGWAGMGRIKPWPCYEGDGERQGRD
jgi:hypothetical protein